MGGRPVLFQQSITANPELERPCLPSRQHKEAERPRKRLEVHQPCEAHLEPSLHMTDRRYL